MLALPVNGFFPAQFIPVDFPFYQVISDGMERIKEVAAAVFKRVVEFFKNHNGQYTRESNPKTVALICCLSLIVLLFFSFVCRKGGNIVPPPTPHHPHHFHHHKHNK